MTSEDLLDNNIYAYSLEQALPELIKTTGYKAKSDKANSDKENSDKANSDKTNNNEANYATFLNKIKENYHENSQLPVTKYCSGLHEGAHV